MEKTGQCRQNFPGHQQQKGSVSYTHLVYETEYLGKKIALTQGFLGAAGSAAQLEELIAMGFSKFIVCGACLLYTSRCV